MLNTAHADTGTDIRYSNGLLSVKAINRPLLSVLESIGKTADVEIFVSMDLKLGDISIQFADEPLEYALKRVLRGLSYAAVYSKDRDLWQITALKIYPKGKYEGELIPVFAGKGSSGNARKKDEETKTVIVSSGSGQFVGQSGLLMPKPYADEYKTVLMESFGKRLEIKEQKVFTEINSLKKRITLAENAEEREALNFVLMDKLAALEKMQRLNRNKLEAFHRIELFNKNKKSSIK